MIPPHGQVLFVTEDTLAAFACGFAVGAIYVLTMIAVFAAIKYWF
jgi:hypothetical protein